METGKSYPMGLSGCSSRDPNEPPDPRSQQGSTFCPGANGSQESCVRANGLPWAHIEKKGNGKLGKIR